MGLKHKFRYTQWAKDCNFKSMLPDDVKARKAAVEAASASQTIIDEHAVPLPPKEHVVLYSDELFEQAAVEWLIETDQPIAAFEHPKFREMVNIAARATNGVKIPNRKATRRAVINLFKKNLYHLRTRFASEAVTGKISTTCDAWQASNGDAYFAVTGHWIEETSPGIWTLKSALLGFTQMNTTHSGILLGRALFKILRRYNIVHRIGWVTCDNASNNNTMLEHLEKLINSHKSHTGMKKWLHRDYHIRCLAHIINLATQAVLKAHSMAKHYNPAEPDAHEPDVEAYLRDEIGLIRAIVVKAQSSAKRKQLLKDIQTRDLKHTGSALQLLLDMAV
jgi:hypothetical protein